MDKISHYNKKLKPLTRELRTDGTPGEAILWGKVLRSKGSGYQFNRQFALKLDELEIIVDFICRKLKLIIEVDGSSHKLKGKEDLRRDDKLGKNGYHVLRIQESEVRYDLDNVVKLIEDTIQGIEEETGRL
ncbi:MAG: endonuclease domain-containing protein [Paludibacteraceae bacterium]